MTREAIGEINCPWCSREAELHQFEERAKLNPEGAQPKSAYPKKFYVLCPPVSGYRGCGTTLANSANAQAQMMELGHVHGSPRKDASAKPAPAKAAESPAAAAPAPVIAKKKPVSLFDW